MNGLELISLSSKAENKSELLSSWSELNQLVGSFIQDGRMVAYLNFKVAIGKIRQGRLEFYGNEEFDPKYLLQLRVFDQDKELHIRRKGEHRFLLRYRTDGEGEPVEAVEAYQMLWGRSRDDVPGWVRLSEKRGVELILPWDRTLKKGSRLWLRTRNYIGYNEETQQAGYLDSRFIEFVPEEDE